MESVHQRGRGGQSARSLLLTVLGELVLPADGPVWTQTLLGALELLGVDPRAARQALNRARARGLLSAQRHGRRVRWQLTPPAKALLAEGTERIYGLGRQRRRWDGRVVLCIIGVPLEREARRRVRTRLAWAGFGVLAPGVWLSPWVERSAQAERVLAELGLGGTASVFLAQPAVGEDPRGLAARAFDLPSLARAYELFLADWGPRLDAPAPEDVAVGTAQLLTLVHRWRQLPFLDPGLPAELLPSVWVGDEAATCFHRLHDRLWPAALQWWAMREPSSPEAGTRCARAAEAF